MAKFTQVLVLSVGTLAGAAVGFYALEAYKVKEKVSSKSLNFEIFPISQAHQRSILLC